MKNRGNVSPSPPPRARLRVREGERCRSAPCVAGEARGARDAIENASAVVREGQHVGSLHQPCIPPHLIIILSARIKIVRGTLMPSNVEQRFPPTDRIRLPDNLIGSEK